MKKDRNTFFQESQMSSFNYYPNQSPMPTQANQASHSFYAGPMPMNIQSFDYSDIESRLAKIERQISRLDARLNKLENSSSYINDDYDASTNMYMV